MTGSVKGVAASALDNIAASFGMTGSELIPILMTLIGPSVRVDGDVVSLSKSDDGTLLVPKRSIMGFIFDIATKSPKKLDMAPALLAIRTSFHVRQKLRSEDNVPTDLATITAMLTAPGGNANVDLVDERLGQLTDTVRNTISSIFG